MNLNPIYNYNTNIILKKIKKINFIKNYQKITKNYQKNIKNFKKN